jgi:hypothetical protein
MLLTPTESQDGNPIPARQARVTRTGAQGVTIAIGGSRIKTVAGAYLANASGVAGDRQHTPRFCHNTQGVRAAGKRAGIAIVFRIGNRSLNKSPHIFRSLEFPINVPSGCFHFFLFSLLPWHELA